MIHTYTHTSSCSMHITLSSLFSMLRAVYNRSYLFVKCVKRKERKVVCKSTLTIYTYVNDSIHFIS